MEQQHTPEHIHNPNIHTVHTVTAANAQTHTTIPATPTVAVTSTHIAGLIEGRIVHYVLSNGRNPGSHRPAIVVKDWKAANGLVQLQVLTDGSNDFQHGQDGHNGILWATSVRYSDAKEPGTWHWIEEA